MDDRDVAAFIENKRTFLDVSADIVEHVDLIFFGDPRTAATKVLG